MTETHTQRVGRVFRELADLRADAESDDGLVTATVDHGGRLRDLSLDPRVYRALDVSDLARDVVAAVRKAAVLAHRKAVEVTAVLLPKSREPDKTDLAFGPALDELDRLIANPPQPYRGDPPDDSLPVLRTSIDYRAFRQNLVDLRDSLAEITVTAGSNDGLINATADGYGRLRDLELNHRLYRVTDSGRLAADITGTVREAAEQASDKVAEASKRIWSSQSLRRLE